MAEPEILTEFNDDKLNQTTPSKAEKLPKIGQPPSRQHLHSKAEGRKTPPVLPFIKNNSTSSAEAPPTILKSGVLPERDDFAL